jgi:transcriptional regulator with XRE-family HTH domain
METQEFLIAVGNIIRSRRKALRLSQERLAELANLHPTYISEIERGKVNASIYCFQTIARALGLEFADFLLLPETPANRVFDQDLSKVFDQMRQLEPAKKELVLSALKGMLVGIL